MNRICSIPGCGTLLSSFNPLDRCASHFATNDEEGFLRYGPAHDPGLLHHLPAWTRYGSCASAGELLEDMFAEETSAGEPTEQVLAAKGLCLGCPVRSDCLDYALEHERGDDFRSGIYGGLSPGERGRIASVAEGMALLDEQAASGLIRERAEVYPYIERKAMEVAG